MDRSSYHKRVPRYLLPRVPGPVLTRRQLASVNFVYADMVGRCIGDGDMKLFRSYAKYIDMAVGVPELYKTIIDEAAKALGASGNCEMGSLMPARVLHRSIEFALQYRHADYLVTFIRHIPFGVLDQALGPRVVDCLNFLNWTVSLNEESIVVACASMIEQSLWQKLCWLLEHMHERGMSVPTVMRTLSEEGKLTLSQMLFPYLQRWVSDAIPELRFFASPELPESRKEQYMAQFRQYWADLDRKGSGEGSDKGSGKK